MYFEPARLDRAPADRGSYGYNPVEACRALIDDFLAPLPPRIQEELKDMIGPRDLRRPGLEVELKKAIFIMERFEETRVRLVHNDPENFDLDMQLMRRFFFYSFIDRFREFKFYTNPEQKLMRPELEMMGNLLEQVHGPQGTLYLANWTGGILEDFHKLPYRTSPALALEGPRELSSRFGFSLQEAMRVLPVDSVLIRLMNPHLLQADLEQIILQTEDAKKERQLQELIKKILTSPENYIGSASLNRLLRTPKVIAEALARHLEARGERGDNSSGAETELERAVNRYCTAALSEQDSHPAKSPDLGAAIKELSQYVPARVRHGLKSDERYLAAYIIADLIRHRMRNLNASYRMIKKFRESIKPELLEGAGVEAAHDLAVAVLNHDRRSRSLVQKRGSTGDIPQPEFFLEVAGVASKAGSINSEREPEFYADRYNGINVRTSGRLYKLLEGLRVTGQCLSYTCSWGESHYTIPEMLFSGTTENLLLEGPHKQICGSLTVRLMPAIVEEHLEPVLFRQKMRVADNDDLYRIALNDMAIVLAALSGVTRIISTSGFIGDPEAHGYNPELYTKGKGMLITYPGKDGRLVSERVVLSHRRRVAKTELIFVEPEISPGYGFHAHDDRQAYRAQAEEICGVKAKTFHDPKDRVTELARFNPDFFVVNIDREAS